MVKLNVHGEVADVQDADQFQPQKTQFACGFFACAMARSMAPVDKPPALTLQQVINDGLQWYAKYDGDPSINNKNGMTTEKEYELLHTIDLHYQETAADINIVKQWVKVGYPVLIAMMEDSVHDLALGDTNPYPWHPEGSHIFLVTGVASDGNVLVRDSANCTNVNDSHSLRPGPRKYDAGKLRLISATVVVPPWLPRPTSNKPPVAVKAATNKPATTPTSKSGTAKNVKSTPTSKANEPGALPLFVDRSRIFPSKNDHMWLVVHKTAGAGTAQQIAHFFAKDPNEASTHYIVDQKGTIAQCVHESDGAGGNCCTDRGHASFLPDCDGKKDNMNWHSISIEFVDPSEHNSTPLTEAQKKAGFKLIWDICQRLHIPTRRGDHTGGIIGHSDISPQQKPECPHAFPWSELWSYLAQQPTSQPTLSSSR